MKWRRRGKREEIFYISKKCEGRRSRFLNGEKEKKKKTSTAKIFFSSFFSDYFFSPSPPTFALHQAMSNFFLLVGLGNPGARYHQTRHNIGFDVLDHLAAKLNLTFSPLPRHTSHVAICERRQIVLMKPQTLMNLSGTAVRSFLKERDIPHERIVVVADNLDVALGSLKLNNRGGAGGQNGVEDILRQLGKTSGFVRMKVGISRPKIGVDPADYVLGRFNQQERIVVEKVKEAAAECLEVFVKDGLAKAMNKYNGVVVKDEAKVVAKAAATVAKAKTEESSAKL